MIILRESISMWEINGSPIYLLAKTKLEPTQEIVKRRSTQGAPAKVYLVMDGTHKGKKVYTFMIEIEHGLETSPTE